MNCLTMALVALTACLANPDPAIRDKVAFERLSTAMRAGDVDPRTLSDIKGRLLTMLQEPDPQGFTRPFVILTLAEVARTDRLQPWMSEDEREQLIAVASGFLSGVTDYRAFNDKEGFRHGVAHGADLAMQLGLSAHTTRPQLDRLLGALASQVSPKDTGVAYWAGEPDRLARAVLMIAQRNLHSAAEWKAWFATVMNPAPLVSWDAASDSEAGIRKRHNVRAFLLSMFATASTAGHPGIQRLLDPLRESLKQVP
jgi:hypothetical protein